jgi:ABC-type Fe3+ transport system permease subunit
LIFLGMGIGVVVVIVDEVLRRSGRYSLPPLAVGMGMYLPIAVTTLIPLGAFIGHAFNRWAERAPNPAFAERLGVLMATGLIVGESLFGVAFAAIVGATDNDAPLALVKEFAWAMPLGMIGLIAAIGWLYMKTKADASSPLGAEPLIEEGPSAGIR